MNKKKATIAFFLLLAFTYVNGQDKIVTTKGDTIFCKIVSISLDFIKYKQNNYNQMSVNYSVPMKQVQEYTLGVRPEDSIPDSFDNTQTAKPLPFFPKKKQAPKPFISRMQNKAPAESFTRWRVGLQGGGSYLINSLAHSRQAMKDLGVSPTAQADSYYKKLRNGISAGADIYYLITRSFGVGLKYSLFNSSVQMNYTVNNGGDFLIHSTIGEKEKFYLNYIGPAVIWQQWIDGNHKFRLNEELSLGYIRLKDQSLFDPNQYVFVNPETSEKQYNVLKEGSTYSGIFQLSLEYYPVPQLSFGVNAAFVPVIFRSLNISDNTTASVVENLGKTHSLDLSRADYSLAVRFHF